MKKNNVLEGHRTTILLIVGILLCLFLVGFSSANLGIFKQNECMNIVTNLNSSKVNISGITTPSPVPEIMYTNQQMTKVGNFFNFTFCNTSKLGAYTYGYCDIEGNCYNNDFGITPSGKISSTSESILYFLFTAILFCLLLTMIYFIIIIPKENETNERGDFIKIIKLKYVRILFISFTYPIIMIILNLMNGLASNFSTLTIFSGAIGFLFGIMMRGVWVFTIIMVLWIFYYLIKDSNIKKQMQKFGRFKF